MTRRSRASVGKGQETFAAATSPSGDLDDDPMIGTVIDGRYELERRLGAGGMGQVYVAKQRSLERRVAVKIVRASLSTDPHLRARFAREAVALAQVNHPHVLHAYDHGVTDDGRLYLVTELLSGRPLDQMIASAPSRQIPLSCVIVILHQLAQALGAVHARLVHRDIKPSNVFVETLETGLRAKLLDFGIIRPSGGSNLTGTGLIGTPPYMSPEQVRQDADIDARSDLYSLGVVAYEMLTGAPPFVSERTVDVLTSHLTVAPAPLPARRRDGEALPPELGKLVMNLLEKARDARPQTAAEVERAVTETSATLPSADFDLPTLDPAGFASMPRALSSAPPSEADWTASLIGAGRRSTAATGALAALGLVMLASIGLATAWMTSQPSSTPLEEPPPPPSHAPVVKPAERSEPAASAPAPAPKPSERVTAPTAQTEGAPPVPPLRRSSPAVSEAKPKPKRRRRKKAPASGAPRAPVPAGLKDVDL